MNKLLFGVVVAAAAGLLAAVLSVTPPTASGTKPAGKPRKAAASLDFVKLDDEAKDFELSSMDGGKVALSRFRDKWVLVNFWATWCPPCLDELPHLAALARAVKEDPITIVLVSVDENKADLEKLASAMKEHPPANQMADIWKATADMIRGRLPNVVALHDPGGGVSHAWGTSKYPETYLVDPGGRRRARFIGPMPWGAPKAIAKLKEMIARPAGGSVARTR